MADGGKERRDDANFFGGVTGAFLLDGSAEHVGPQNCGPSLPVLLPSQACTQAGFQVFFIYGSYVSGGANERAREEKGGARTGLRGGQGVGVQRRGVQGIREGEAEG